MRCDRLVFSDKDNNIYYHDVCQDFEMAKEVLNRNEVLGEINRDFKDVPNGDILWAIYVDTDGNVKHVFTRKNTWQ